ncbi:MAG TPA: HutD family protein, partial [Polyangiaceae bacterium]
MKKLDATEHRSMPWKNGGGVTIEVAKSPEGASLDDFDWRISMARVEASGPFSRFPGIDRSLVVLRGAGMTLDVAQRGSIVLDAHAPPFAFPGDVDVAATLRGGRVDDLNVMTRRGRFRALVTRVFVEGSAPFAPLGDLCFLVVGAGRGRAEGGGTTLAEGDALRLEAGERVDVASDDEL